MCPSAAELYAQLYDAVVPGWPGEIEFYRALAAEARAQGMPVLEVACGTGRVALHLAQEGTRVVGFDLSAPMLAQARAKSAGLANVRLTQADMRAFDLGEAFGLAIIPGHSFQFMLTPEDQVACLECIARHLAPGGRLVVHLDHQDVAWLGDLRSGQGGVFRPASEVVHPTSGRRYRATRAWSYEPATQTATAVTVWEELGAGGEVVGRWQMEPVHLHCLFRFEMAHLLARVGLEVEALYGDFQRGPLTDESREMVWLARKRTGG